MESKYIKCNQKKYGDTIFEWEIIANNGETKEEVLKYAQTLRKADRERREYLSAIRSHLSLNEILDIEAGGSYELMYCGKNNEGNEIYTYKVIEAYLD